MVIWQKEQQVYGNIIFGWRWQRQRRQRRTRWFSISTRTDRGVFINWQHSSPDSRDEELIVFVGWFICFIRFLWLILVQVWTAQHSSAGLDWQCGGSSSERVAKGRVWQDSYRIVIVMAQWTPVLCSLIRFMNTPGCLSLLETVLFSGHQWHMSSKAR